MSSSEYRTSRSKRNIWSPRRRKRRVYSRPELQWGVGDEPAEFMADVPDSFQLMPPDQSSEDRVAHFDGGAEADDLVGTPSADFAVEETDHPSADLSLFSPGERETRDFALSDVSKEHSVDASGRRTDFDAFKPGPQGAADVDEDVAIIIEPEAEVSDPADESDAKPQRLESTRQRLDKALEQWWQKSELPTTALLRDSLLLLESGYSLDEAHLSLLLRTALASQRGMLTALRHQTDPDRSAFLLKEALLDERHPLKPSDIAWLLAEDEKSAEWSELLLDDLQVDHSSLSGEAQRTVDEVIRTLKQGAGTGVFDIVAVKPVVKYVPIQLPQPIYWNAGRIILALLFATVLISSWRWLQGRALLPDMVVIETGSYLVGNSDIGVAERSVTVPTFELDRTEVTNRSYQLCYEQGACLAPIQPNSPTRTAYFLHRAYEEYPVIYVDWTRARQYCAWAGKRLPTEDEWEIAASAAPATNRRFLYPWGDRFNRLYANSARADGGDTQQVGLYHPVGTSPLGAMDMAGNVAEWTSTQDVATENGLVVIKGGSFIDEPELLLASQRVVQHQDFSAPWLGFRCANSVE